AGGLTLTQTLGDAEYDSMLVSAVRTGLVDRELAIEEMPGAFIEFLVRRVPLTTEIQVQDGERAEICKLLRAVTGHDFSGYKVGTVDRRIRRRMQVAGAQDLAGYVTHLQKDKEEAAHLFRDLLIGVTQFFRGPDSFAALAKSVIPKILEGKTADDEVRWVPGCATGEEVYSLAMLLHEHAATLDSMPSLKIFGSDIDDSGLHFARLGRYPKGIAADVSPDRLERFFEREDGTYCVRSQLREMCLFAQHNVLRDPPFSRLDLISCRNLLIYLDADLQRRLMPVFHYALRPERFIAFGPAEGPAQQKLFKEVDRKHRIFQRIGEAATLPDFPIAGGNGKERLQRPVTREPTNENLEGLSGRAARRVLAEFAPAYVVIDADYEILEASAGTGAYLELPSGRPRMNLNAMARSGLAIDVRAAVTKVMATGRRETRSGLTVADGEHHRQLTLVVDPMAGQGKTNQLYLVVFQAGPPLEQQLDSQRERDSDREVNRALEMELQTTKERLQSTLEELETSNEELKASNEELSSVNEELQSSNEELETSKEELQSINEELRTVNNELSSRVEDLAQANNDLKNLFANTEIAMLFLDRDFRIKNFTPPAKPLFHLRDHDVGRPLDELAGRLDFQSLKAEVQAVVRDGQSREREVQTNGAKSQRTFILRILPYRDEDERTRGAVLTLIDISERKRSEQRLSAMVSELNHRVKNSLAGVQAIMRQARAGATSVEEFGKVVEGRVQAMAVAHNLLSQGAWEHAQLRNIAEAVLAPFAEDGSERLRLSGPTVELRPGIVVALGLVLHELAT
ncbi:MAG TPA: CheR family methyltransferase, partial [Aquabacterium sp.]|nr:CheR family methyltransferase [Aquabacterium sp.]